MEEETCKKTLAVLEYKGKKYYVTCNWYDGYPIHTANFMWEEGNYSCDCNKSIFIREQYADDYPPLLSCGDKIKLIELWHD